MPPLGPSREILTPHDWASEFDREFSTGEPMSTWSASSGAEGDVPAIVVPPLDDDGDGVLSTPGSAWSFTGEDEGEDLPPTNSPTFGNMSQVPAAEPLPVPGVDPTEAEDPGRGEALKEAMEGSTIHPDQPLSESEHPQPRLTASLTNIAASPTPLAAPSSPKKSSDSTSGTSSGPIPIRSPTTPSIPIPHHHRDSGSSSNGQAISLPGPALLAAATIDERLGPGVSPDTKVTPFGMLRKEVGGEVIEVPADEVVLSAEGKRERRGRDVSEGLGGKRS